MWQHCGAAHACLVIVFHLLQALHARQERGHFACMVLAWVLGCSMQHHIVDRGPCSKLQPLLYWQ